MNLVVHVLILLCLSPVILIALLLYLLVVVLVVFPIRCLCGVSNFETYISWLFWPATLCRDFLWYKFRAKPGLVLYVDLGNESSMSKCSPPCKPPGTLRFVCISDTHEKHWLLDVPKGDVLIHCGDILFQDRGKGTDKLIDFNEFLNTLPHTHKIVIAGNHDAVCARYSQAEVQSFLSSCIYLDNQLTMIGGLRIYGCANSRIFGSRNSAFQLESTELSAILDRVPTDLDILMTHVGKKCELTDEMVTRVQPKVHVYGHFHNQYGVSSRSPTVSINASSLDGFYSPTHLPIVFDIPLRQQDV